MRVAARSCQRYLSASFLEAREPVFISLIDAEWAGHALAIIRRLNIGRAQWPAAGVTLDVATFCEIAIDRQQRVVISCPTEGASLAVSVDGGDWRLYTTPLTAGGAAKIAAKAVRYGWHESDEVRLQVR